MRIGSDDTFLILERVERRGLAPKWRVAAATGDLDCWFAAMHHGVEAANGEDMADRLAEFIAGKTDRVEITLSQGGWIRLRRHPSGSLLVRYRVAQANSGAALEGEVNVESKAAQNVCRQLAGLF